MQPLQSAGGLLCVEGLCSCVNTPRKCVPGTRSLLTKSLVFRALRVSKKILKNDFTDTRPEWERSPEPDPVYDNNGIRVNTREIRARERAVERRNDVIELLMQKCTVFRPPTDWKPQKKKRKIPIPVKEYPNYNFFGLIIGPRGNTQKRMQKETNCKIAIRGRGSVKEGAARDSKARRASPCPHPAVQMSPVSTSQLVASEQVSRCPSHSPASVRLRRGRGAPCAHRGRQLGERQRRRRHGTYSAVPQIIPVPPRALPRLLAALCASLQQVHCCSRAGVWAEPNIVKQDGGRSAVADAFCSQAPPSPQVSRLLVPVDEEMNDHKRQQLRELAAINGTLRDESYYKALEAQENEQPIFALPDEIKSRADAQYARDVARFHGADAANKLNNEYENFIAELGGNPVPSGAGAGTHVQSGPVYLVAPA